MSAPNVVEPGSEHNCVVITVQGAFSCAVTARVDMEIT
jgi:hypothetical protein